MENVLPKWKKKSSRKIKRINVEKRFTKDDFFKYLMEEDYRIHPIHKTRYCLSGKKNTLKQIQYWIG